MTFLVRTCFLHIKNNYSDLRSGQNLPKPPNSKPEGAGDLPGFIQHCGWTQQLWEHPRAELNAPNSPRHWETEELIRQETLPNYCLRNIPLNTYIFFLRTTLFTSYLLCQHVACCKTSGRPCGIPRGEGGCGWTGGVDMPLILEIGPEFTLEPRNCI